MGVFSEAGDMCVHRRGKNYAKASAREVVYYSLIAARKMLL